MKFRLGLWKEALPLLYFVKALEKGHRYEYDNCFLSVANFYLHKRVRGQRFCRNCEALDPMSMVYTGKISPKQRFETEFTKLACVRSIHTSRALTNCKGRKAVFMSAILDSRS